MLFSHLLGVSPGWLFRLYSWTHSLAFYSRLACPPADLQYSLPFFVGWSLFHEGLQSWLGGLASLAFCVAGLLWFSSGFMGNFQVSAICFSRDWARCRAALGANKICLFGWNEEGQKNPGFSAEDVNAISSNCRASMYSRLKR